MLRQAAMEKTDIVVDDKLDVELRLGISRYYVARTPG
jgi:hypothetical protein